MIFFFIFKNSIERKSKKTKKKKKTYFQLRMIFPFLTRYPVCIATLGVFVLPDIVYFCCLKRKCDFEGDFSEIKSGRKNPNKLTSKKIEECYDDAQSDGSIGINK